MDIIYRQFAISAHNTHWNRFKTCVPVLSAYAVDHSNQNFADVVVVGLVNARAYDRPLDGCVDSVVLAVGVVVVDDMADDVYDRMVVDPVDASASALCTDYS